MTEDTPPPVTLTADPSTAPPTDRPVEVLGATMRIHELSIERPSIVAYLGKIAPEKQEIAKRQKKGSGPTTMLRFIMLRSYWAIISIR